MTGALELSDPVVFARIYRRHHRLVMGSAWRIVRDRELAEDLAQDVFAWLWSNPHVYDGRVGLSAYLAVVARSRAIDALRSARARSRLDERLRTEATTRAAFSDDVALRSIVRHEEAGEVRALVAQLSAVQRQALAMTYWGELPVAAVAARLGLPKDTVKSRVRLARARLARRLASASA
jgi:RNA polymerase sigma-70 factor (ECF subfamily)